MADKGRTLRDLMAAQTEMKHLGLRERQKADRRRHILDVAKSKFQTDGYANVTMEAIANDANVSSVTVYNYYKSKAGLLLALVAESDKYLIAQLEEMISGHPDDLIDAVARFGQILRRHAMSYLSKPTWREVVSASIHEGSRDFGRTYMDLDRVLVELMQSLVEDAQERKLISSDIDSLALADCLFSLQNIRFFQFIADDDISDEEIDARFRHDLIALAQMFGQKPE